MLIQTPALDICIYREHDDYGGEAVRQSLMSAGRPRFREYGADGSLTVQVRVINGLMQLR